MRFPGPIHDGVLLRRYKRFLADVRLADGTEVVAHCPNSGRMTACWAPGVPCRVSHRPDPRRKLAWTLEQTCMDGTWVLVDTALPNGVVAEGILAGTVPDLAGYATLETERRWGGSRIDLRLSDPDRPRCWVEVKNVTLAEGGVARFPDAVSARATRHLHTLAEVVAAGERGVLLFHVGRADAAVVRPADDVDPVYGAALREAAAAGIEVLAHRGQVGREQVVLGEAVPVDLSGP